MSAIVETEIIEEPSGYYSVCVSLKYKLGMEDRIEKIESECFPTKELARRKEVDFWEQLRSNPDLKLERATSEQKAPFETR